MGDSQWVGQETWKALYSDSSEGEEAAVRAPRAQAHSASTLAVKRTRSVIVHRQPEEEEGRLVTEIKPSLVAPRARRSRQAVPSTSSVKPLHAAVGGCANGVSPPKRPKVEQAHQSDLAPCSPSLKVPRRASAGPLDLLEPDSSDSECGKIHPSSVSGTTRTRKSDLVAQVAQLQGAHLQIMEPAKAEVLIVPASTSSAHEPLQPVRQVQTEMSTAASSSSAPPRQAPLEPQLDMVGDAVDRKDLLSSFAGPDSGLATRWSEGSLVLPNDAELPECVAACLRPYQRKGVQWLCQKLFVEDAGCLLTDEMGLGKTVQVACCLAGGLYGPHSTTTAEAPGPVLVLCPPSLVQNWARELRRWGPFAVEVLGGGPNPASGRLRALQRVDAGLADVLVASRGLLQGDDSGECLLRSRRWGCLVIDEMHQAKNPKGNLHRALVNLRCQRKLGLTGTPLQNSLTDMWAMLRIVEAHEGWDLSAFESRFGRPIARGQKRKASVQDLAVREDALKEFNELVGRSCLRRTKADVALMLPGKNDRIVPCPLSSIQRAAYANLLASPDWQMALGKRQLCVCGLGRPCLCGVGPVWRYIHQRQAEQKGLEDEYAAADDCVCRGRCPPRCLCLSLIVFLQRITNHVELLKPDLQPSKDTAEQAQQQLMCELCDIAFAGVEHNLCTRRRVANRIQLGSPDACGKMQMLLPLLRHWRKRGQKVLLFSRSTRLLDILEACLFQQGWSPQVLRLDGGTPAGHRQKLVDEFNSSSTRGVFLISTRAGGVGLNLTSACVVVIFDPDWNPFSDLQAQDRSFRIGQTRVVEVYRLLSAGTIEEQVYVRQVWKQQLAATAIDGTRAARRLDDSSFGIRTLFELHDSSCLPSLMAEACTTKSQPHDEGEAGVPVFQDLRGAASAGMKLTDLWQPDEPGDSSEKDEEGELDEAAADNALALLHGMFDQVNHAQVLRSDTQENLLLSDLPDA